MAQHNNEYLKKRRKKQAGFSPPELITRFDPPLQ